MKYLLILAIFINLYTDEYLFYPSGAPLDRCGSMMPGHHAAPIDGPAPFEISLARAHHEEAVAHGDDNKFYVNLHTKDESIKFKGFLLEARGRWDGESIGVWNTDVKHTKTLDCFGRAKVKSLFDPSI